MVEVGMLEEMAVGLVKQVPELVILAFIVRWFLRARAEGDDKLSQAVSKINVENHQVLRETQKVMRQTSEQLGVSKEVTTALLRHLQTCCDHKNR